MLTVQEALEEAVAASAYAATHGNPAPLQTLLDGLCEVLWDEMRDQVRGGTVQP